MKNTVKSIISLLLIAVLMGGLLFGLNRWTAPLVEARQAAEEEAAAAAGQEMLLNLLPGSAAFELIYDAQDPGASALHDVPEAVQTIYAEQNGLGYVLALTTSDGYTKEPMEFSMGVDQEGKISGMEITAYPAEERDIASAGLPESFVGQDSALAQVELVANMTVSSTAFKNAVTAGFDALIANDLVGAGVKDDSQLLVELLDTLAPDVRRNDEKTALEVDGSVLLSGWLAKSGAQAAYMVQDSGATYLVLANVEGLLRAYDAQGNDVTEQLSETAAEAVRASAAGALASFTDTDLSRFQKMLEDEEAVITPLPLETVSSVVGLYRIESQGQVFCGVAARPFGYMHAIQSYLILDAEGAIVKMNVVDLVQEDEYFPGWGGFSTSAYLEDFLGQSEANWDDSVTHVTDTDLDTSATISSEAMRRAMADSFEAFRVLMENGGLDA